MKSSIEEKIFFLSHLKPEHKVLEYGSGSSTLDISRLVAKLISVEHNIEWFTKMKRLLPSDITIIYKPPHYPLAFGDDGNYEQFKDYVNAPIPFALFDIIFIDGRARVGCASVCKQLGHKNTIVFIHDFDRLEYQPALEYLELIEQVGTMAKFKIK